jgi:hypothetical protein
MARKRPKAGKLRRDGLGHPLTGEYSIALPDGTRGEVRRKCGVYYLLLPASAVIRPAIRRKKRLPRKPFRGNDA